jgi:hypothetical protein
VVDPASDFPALGARDFLRDGAFNGFGGAPLAFRHLAHGLLRNRTPKRMRFSFECGVRLHLPSENLMDDVRPEALLIMAAHSVLKRRRERNWDPTVSEFVPPNLPEGEELPC